MNSYAAGNECYQKKVRSFSLVALVPRVNDDTNEFIFNLLIADISWHRRLILVGRLALGVELFWSYTARRYSYSRVLLLFGIDSCMSFLSSCLGRSYRLFNF